MDGYNNSAYICVSDHCPYFNEDIYHRDRDDFYFPPVLRNNIPNPILINITDYKGGIRIKTTITDDDDVGHDDLVDNYNEDISITPSTSAHSASTHSYTLTGPGYSQTTIEVKVYCGDNFYGSHCSVKCVTFDNDEDGHYTCDPSTGEKICLPGYKEPLCKIEINECESSHCLNGGSCRDHLNYFTCECKEGTSGDRCEINFDECVSEPCQHQSTCVDQINGYRCHCVDGYTGPTCSIDVDECVSTPCQNNATCIDQVNNYICKCQQGYEGSQCEFKVNACASGPCENNSTCVDFMDGFSCDCSDGFEGEFCETEKDECQSNPCQNTGSCVDLINGFHCDCVAGYSGLLCEKDLDECTSGPCANGATCIDDVNRYNCSCPSGFKGDLCEIEINECESSPCQNSGTCLDMINGFQCNCTSGYYGLLCETDHDDCASGACSNERSMLLTSLPVAAGTLIGIVLIALLITRHYYKRRNSREWELPGDSLHPRAEGIPLLNDVKKDDLDSTVLLQDSQL